MADAPASPREGSAGAGPGDVPWLARPRVEAALVAGVVLLAFALRLVHALATRDSPLFDAPQMDALYHVEWARAFAAGERFQPPPFFRAPLYPWMLGSLFALFGEGLLLPRLVQAALGAAGTLLVVLCARRAFDPAVGLVAGLLWATSWVGIFFDGELLLETLAVPLSLLGLWLTLGLDEAPRPRRLFAAGAAWGLSAITRLNVLLLMPLLALWLFRRVGGDLRRRLLAPAWLAAGVLLPILPITAYNAVAGDDLVLVASQGGLNLWIGNNPSADGSSAIAPGTRADWWGGHHDAIAQAERAAGRPLRPSEVSRHFARRALAFMGEEPGAWLDLMGRKLRLFLWNAELGNNEEPRFLFERFSPLAPLAWVGFGVLAPLALLGLVVGARGGASRLPLWGYLLAYSASVVLFFVNARFRLPLLPVLAIYAALGLVWSARAARRGQWTRLGPALFAVVLLSILCHRVPAFAADAPRRAPSNGHLILAVAAVERGDREAAAELFEEAVRLFPRNGIAWRGLGFVRRDLGLGREAESCFRRALEIRPDDADSLDALADLLLGAERYAEARPFALRLRSTAPSSPRGPYALGRVLFGTSDLEGAARAFEQALEVGPRHFGATYSLGVVRLLQERAQDALAAFERALEADEPDPVFLADAYQRAVELRRARGEAPAARALAERMRARFGDTPEVRAVFDSL